MSVIIVCNFTASAVVLLPEAVNEEERNLIMFTANQIANNNCSANAYLPH